MSEIAIAEDRISNLPEPLLHHILSFLGIKDGARTSVLSHRWNNIQTTVPILEFQRGFDHFLPSSFETRNFVDFVDGTLGRHNSSNIDRFFLQWDVPLNESQVHSWISTVIRCKVKHIGLQLWQEQPLFIPPPLSTCESLVSLQLDTRPTILFPRYISLPRLKRLELHHFVFTDKYLNEELFSNCPVLEELILECSMVSLGFLRISIPTLKLLKINTWRVDRNGLQNCFFEINAPTLVSFSYSGYVPKEFVFSRFLAIVEANVNCVVEENDGAQISQLLRALAHVKYLTVCDGILQAICSTHDLLSNLLTFHNVKMLRILHMLTTDDGLVALLKAVPNLESLIIEEFFIEDEEEDDDSWAFDKMTTGCLFPQLKSVCFQQSGGNPREMRWVKLILRNAKTLQMMTIRYCNSPFENGKSENELMVEIPSIPRASSACVFRFCSTNWKSVIISRT